MLTNSGGVRIWPASLGAGIFLHIFMGIPMWLCVYWSLTGSIGESTLGRIGAAALFLSVAMLTSFRLEIRRRPDGAFAEEWSVILPLRRKVFPSGAFTHVLVDAVEESGGGEYATGIQTSYRVSLAGPKDTLQIESFADFEKASKEAERVSTLAILPVKTVEEVVPYDWGKPLSARATIVFGAVLTLIGLALVGLMVFISDWTRWFASPFAAFFLFFGILLLWMGIARWLKERA